MASLHSHSERVFCLNGFIAFTQWTCVLSEWLHCIHTVNVCSVWMASLHSHSERVFCLNGFIAFTQWTCVLSEWLHCIHTVNVCAVWMASLHSHSERVCCLNGFIAFTQWTCVLSEWLHYIHTVNVCSVWMASLHICTVNSYETFVALIYFDGGPTAGSLLTRENVSVPIADNTSQYCPERVPRRDYSLWSTLWI